MRSALAMFVAGFVWLAATGSAQAIRRCGDVGPHGRPVACSCGDLLVSSRTLGPADPVTNGRCGGNGLVVVATGSVLLDLGGRTIVGSGNGVGILVLRGRLALAGPGSVEGFAQGVVARADGLERVHDVRVAANRQDGLVADGDGFSIEASVAEGNGRDGFALGGRRYALDGNRASGNGRYGFHLAGMGAHAGGGVGNEARGNGGAGFWLLGGLHQVVGATAIGNRGDGLFASVAHTSFADVRTDANVGDGLFAIGAAIAARDARASGNRGSGIWIVGRDAVDGGGNGGVDNAGLIGRGGLRSIMMREMMPALLQCRIGDRQACR